MDQAEAILAAAIGIRLVLKSRLHAFENRPMRIGKSWGRAPIAPMGLRAEANDGVEIPSLPDKPWWARPVSAMCMQAGGEGAQDLLPFD